jgi:hypothetical protein
MVTAHSRKDHYAGQVESQTNGNGIEKPKRLRLDGRTIEVIENVDRWLGRTTAISKSRVTTAISTFFAWMRPAGCGN